MCLLMIIIPFIVYPMVSNNTHDEWSVVFILFAILLVCCGVYFALRGSGEAAHFTGVPNRERQQELKPVVEQPEVQIENR